MFIAFEITFIFFMFPETVNKSIEELAFLFEDDAHAEQAKRMREQAESEAEKAKVLPAGV